MKIVAVLENTISAGGGFSQALSAILQIKKIAEKNGYTLQVVTSEERNIAVLHSLAIDCTVYRMPSYTKFFQYLIESSFMVKKVLDFMYKRNWLYPIERILTKQRPDILYFLQPSRIPKYLKNINFIYTLWDVGHRDFPEFPEVRREGVFLDRETAYKNILPAAFLTITDSDTLSARLQYLYNLDRERLLAMPFNINPLLGQTSAEEVVEHQDVEGGFLFYPAQFWPHKNHIRILQAILGLREQGRSVKVVFVGGDKLNQGHVRNFIAMNKLESQVKILGFVEIEEIKRLYQSCIALIMPTYFGPTNIPPFEAWSYGKPVIYSDHLKAQVGDAAICVDPDSPQAIANAIIDVFDQEKIAVLIEKGKERLAYYDDLRNVAEADFLKHLIKFDQRSRNWG